MAMMQKIKNLFETADKRGQDSVSPAPPNVYTVGLLKPEDLVELMKISLRCFTGSESYNKETFEYLLREPHALGYKAVTEDGSIAGFLFIIANKTSIAHITTIAVAPEHRKRRVAQQLLRHAEKALKTKGLESVVLEVRISNYAAQNLYANLEYVIIQKLVEYYNDKEDAYLMSKSLL
jgi:ribosomal-protein-alanine N-acetyltransferase